MRNLLLLLLPLTLLAALPEKIALHDGPVTGTTGNGVRIFRGVEYATAERWSEPQPTAWTQVRHADQFGPNCVQTITDSKDPWTSEFMAHGPISERCLYLNIWTAANSANDKRPVLVWIHGGAFNEGSGAIAAYDGQQLAKKGLVVVTINYRMGIFGFFAHPDLTKESPHNSSGNYGLLDQVAALRWVQRNIAAFGGDPARVTLAGQSAGGSSVHALMASPLAKGLFHRAIIESGSPGRNLRSLKDAEQEGLKFAASISDLRAKTADQVRIGAPRGGPIADGWLIPAAGAEPNDIPVLTGIVWDEGSSSATYLTSDTNAARNRGLESIYQWADTRAKTATTKVFTYIFDHPEPGPNSAKYRAFHTSDVPYVFNSLAKCDRPWTPDDHRIADMMSSYWANFAATGDPNGKGLPVWAAFTPSSRTTMELGDRNQPLTIPQ